MIHNIIDRRKRPHRWKLIDAIVEPNWHDNSVADSDKAEATQGEIDYEERKGLSVADAIAWAKAFPFPVTIYLYDEGEVALPSQQHITSDLIGPTRSEARTMGKTEAGAEYRLATGASPS